MFAGRDIPAVGFSLGLDRLEVVMEELGLFPEQLQGPQVMIPFMETAVASMAMASKLREAGLRVEVFPEKAKFGKQIQYAEEIGARVLVTLGSQEVAQGLATVQVLATREKRQIPQSEVVAALQDILGAVRA